MNYTITSFVLLAVAMLYMAWRWDIALKKSRPVEFTKNEGRIKPHVASVVVAIVAIILCLMTVFGLITSDVEWPRKLGPILIIIATTFLFTRLLPPWNEVCWSERGLEGYCFSWRYPIIPQHRKISWQDIVEVKRQGGGTILLDKNNRRLLAWPVAYLGHTFLNEHVAKKRPDLFYPPYYLEPIPRKK